jgi:hypothetical protein
VEHILAIKLILCKALHQIPVDHDVEIFLKNLFSQLSVIVDDFLESSVIKIAVKGAVNPCQ